MNWRLLKMIIWQRSGGYWLFWASVIYFVVGMCNEFVYTFTKTEYIQIVWILIISVPLWCKPLARWLNMRTFWEI
jgi:hypothetical protein